MGEADERHPDGYVSFHLLGNNILVPMGINQANLN